MSPEASGLAEPVSAAEAPLQIASEPPSPERTAAPSRCELVKNRARVWRRSAFAAYKCVSRLPRRRPKSPQERGNVKKALAVALIVGFLLVDFLFFHDIFKSGETVTFAQYLTGVLSIPVLVVSALYLLRGTCTVQK